MYTAKQSFVLAFCCKKRSLCVRKHRQIREIFQMKIDSGIRVANGITNCYTADIGLNHCTDVRYNVKQSDRSSLKIVIFYMPTTYEQHVKTSSEKKITFARHETDE